MPTPELPRSPHDPRGHLPRLEPEWYRGPAVVFWTHTIDHRRTGWLNAQVHAAAREHLLCPIYTLMPDHLHLVWMGVSAASDQRRATAFLRTQLKPHLAPARWQHQPHDHVLRDEERKRGAFASTCCYVAENPVRAALATKATEWAYTGCVVAGYPTLHPLAEDFWEKFWRIFSAALARGSAGKIDAESL